MEATRRLVILILNNNNNINLPDPPQSNNDSYASYVKYVKQAVSDNNATVEANIIKNIDKILAETLIWEYYTTHATSIYRIDRGLSSEVKIDSNGKFRLFMIRLL